MYIRSGSVFTFVNGNIGCLTKTGLLVVVHPTGWTTKRHPKALDYLSKHDVVNVEESTDENEPMLDVGDEINLVSMKLAA